VVPGPKVKRAEQESWDEACTDTCISTQVYSHPVFVSYLRERIGFLDVRIKDSEDQLCRLQSSRTDELQAFGPLMRSLKEALQDNQQRFRKMPKGPVGSYVRLKDYKWSTAVEQVLKGVLFCFVVDNAYDDAESIANCG